MTAEERIQHAKLLMEHPSWQLFLKDMKDLKELKASELNAAYLNDRSFAGAFTSGFRLALETVIEYPERTIKKNKGLVARMKEALAGE